MSETHDIIFSLIRDQCKKVNFTSLVRSRFDSTADLNGHITDAIVIDRRYTAIVYFRARFS